MSSTNEPTPVAPTARHQRIWSAVFDELDAWTKANGRLPKRRAKDSEEYRLANWLNVQRANHRAGKLHPDYITALGGIQGAFETRRTRTHREWASEIADFHATHGRTPAANASDPEERSLGHYLTERLRPGVASGVITSADSAPLASVPNALSPLRHRTTSAQYLEQLRAHVAATGVMPGWKDERPLARWVRRVLTASTSEHTHTFYAEVNALRSSLSGPVASGE